MICAAEKTLDALWGKKTIEVLEKFNYVKVQNTGVRSQNLKKGVRSQNPGVRIVKRSILKLFQYYQHLNFKMRSDLRGFSILYSDSWLLTPGFLLLAFIFLFNKV